MLPNKSPEPTAVGAVRSAVAVHVAGRRWLSFGSLGHITHLMKARKAIVVSAVLIVAAIISTLTYLHHSRQDNPGPSGTIPPSVGPPKTAEQATTAILEAWAKDDWNGFEDKFVIPGSTFAAVPDTLKKLTPGMELLKIGKPDNSSVSNTWAVPCRVRLKSGEVRDFRMLLKQMPGDNRWIFNGFTQ